MTRGSISDAQVMLPKHRIGIVGAGRTRQGLGPYLAAAFEAAGCTVTAVAGRDRAGAERAAAALAPRLGHPVAATENAAALAAMVDLLVVAAPVPGHLAGLDAALAAGVPCLCEKPLVDAVDLDAGLQRIAAFRRRGLLLAENCQWPFVLPAFFALHQTLRGAPVQSVAMGLGPAWPGPAMVMDSLSHVLSLVQGLVDLPGGTAVANVSQSDAGATAERNLVQFEVRGPHGPIDVSLHLQRCPEQPRPAWFAVNGVRVDRRLGPDYTISFAAADGRTIAVHDPLHQLVAACVLAVREGSRERVERSADAIALRLRLYSGILGALCLGS